MVAGDDEDSQLTGQHRTDRHIRVGQRQPRQDTVPAAPPQVVKVGVVVLKADTDAGCPCSNVSMISAMCGPPWVRTMVASRSLPDTWPALRRVRVRTSSRAARCAEASASSRSRAAVSVTRLLVRSNSLTPRRVSSEASNGQSRAGQIRPLRCHAAD